MASAISFTDLPTFDGLIAYAYAREKMQGKPIVTRQYIPDEELIDFSEMPIKKHPNGYFMASQMMYDEQKATESVERWRKRWHNKHESLADFGQNKRKVDVQRGEFKSYDMPIRLVSVPEVWFLFESDDIQEVENLVTKYIFGIGKKRTVGHGEIDGFSICETTNEGIIRPIPLRFREGNEGGMIKLCTWHPPYWDVSKAEICLITTI